MKIVVIGGTGLIGSKLVEDLRTRGHEAVPAAPNTGVNTITGEGLAEAFDGASVVVDVANAPAWGDAEVLEFFETSTRNQLKAEANAGVGHHVALSIVGTERIPDSGYLIAKRAQEDLIESSSIPYTIVHATQFYEFGTRIADGAMEGNAVRVPDALIQPIAADDVAAAVCKFALAAPLNGVVEIGGPEALQFEDFIRRALRAAGDDRVVVTDQEAQYFGAHLQKRALVPGDGAQLASTSFDDWAKQQAKAG